MRTLYVALVALLALAGCGPRAQPTAAPAPTPVEQLAPQLRCSAPMVLIPEGAAREFCLDPTEVSVVEYAR